MGLGLPLRGEAEAVASSAGPEVEGLSPEVDAAVEPVAIEDADTTVAGILGSADPAADDDEEAPSLPGRRGDSRTNTTEESLWVDC